MKQCPLKFKREGLHTVDTDCAKGSCAWWLDRKYAHETGCALFVIAGALIGIDRKLHDDEG